MKTITIGRDETCNILVQDPSNLVSRHHATLMISKTGKMTLTDSSTNGTYINGIKISSNVPVPVTRKDVVSFAHVSELNWDQVPKGEIGKYLLAAASSLVILACAVLLIKTLIQKPKDNSNHKDNTTLTTDTTQQTITQQQPTKEYDTKVDVQEVKENITSKEAADSIASFRKQMQTAEDTLTQVKSLAAKADSLYKVKYGNKDTKYADALQRASYLIGGYKQAVEKLDAAAVYKVIDKAEIIVNSKGENVAGALNEASEATARFAKLVFQLSPDLQEAIQKLSTINDPQPEPKNDGGKKKLIDKKKDEKKENSTPVDASSNINL